MIKIEFLQVKYKTQHNKRCTRNINSKVDIYVMTDKKK